MSGPATELTARAGAVVDAIAERLADPGRIDFPSGRARPRSSLDRYCGVALLYAELGRVDSAYRTVAHRHLAEANRTLDRHGHHSLYDGVPALAFAAAISARTDGEYAKLLAGLDESVFRVARVLLDEENARIRAGKAAENFMKTDVISGLAGIGRYLLKRSTVSAEADALVREVCAYYGALVRPITHNGRPAPGWCSETDPASGDRGSGNLNLGMAHGIPGPLALLAAAWRSGVRVGGHAETVETIVDFLIEWSDVDEYGRYWPAMLTLDEYAGRPERLSRSRNAWCYGSPGVARAIQLAGLAFGRDDWIGFARDAARDMFRMPGELWGVRDSCLCHGWSGLLHVIARMDADDPRCELGAARDRLAERTVASFEPDLPYGYRRAFGPGPDDFCDAPGFLTGAAGIALALHAYRTDPRPASGWDIALLVD